MTKNFVADVETFDKILLFGMYNFPKVLNFWKIFLLQNYIFKANLFKNNFFSLKKELFLKKKIIPNNNVLKTSKVSYALKTLFKSRFI